MDKTVNITISFSDFGCPLFLPDEGASLRLSVAEGGSAEEGKEMKISGNRAGLEALAKAILATAMAEDSDYHLHLDDLYANTIKSPQGYSLTISRMKESS